jgi:uncharacterized protein (DUF2252 family)
MGVAVERISASQPRRGRSPQLPSEAIVQEILRFNQGRDPRRLRLKYTAMRASAFAFLRGTCHLFYAGMPAEPILHSAPLAWVCGDLHLENFGAYKGDNRLTYFDLNDFDEACLAPCTWELLRMLTSIFLAGDELGSTEGDAVKLCRAFLEAYCAQLSGGKPRWIERPLAQGLIRDLLQDLKRIQRAKFLDKRTIDKGKHRRLRVDGKHALETLERERTQVEKQLARFARGQKHADFYRVLDMADRIAGTGSLGVKRYAVLVEGRGSPDGNFLLDVKEALPSAPARHLTIPQGSWANEAQRVVTLQCAMEAIAPALLTTLEIGGRPYVLRELQPIEQRVNLAAHRGSLGKLEIVIRSMGDLTAWSELRVAGWRGSATREELSDFGADARWCKQLLGLARQRSRLMTGYWQEYCVAYDAGAFADESPGKRQAAISR